jgi:hypothetical protein
MFEGTAEPARLDPYHRIALGVEVRIALEHLGSDRVRLDAVRTSGERLLDDIAQKPARTRGEVEVRAGDEAFELGAHVFGRRLRLRLRQAINPMVGAVVQCAGPFRASEDA